MSDLVRGTRAGEMRPAPSGVMVVELGKIVKWDEAVEKGPKEVPDLTSWDVKPPIMPDEDGVY